MLPPFSKVQINVWYGQIDIVPVAGVSCSLLVSLGESTDSVPPVSFSETTETNSCLPCTLCSRYPCSIQETYLVETCYVEADAWLL